MLVGGSGAGRGGRKPLAGAGLAAEGIRDVVVGADCRRGAVAGGGDELARGVGADVAGGEEAGESVSIHSLTKMWPPPSIRPCPAGNPCSA